MGLFWHNENDYFQAVNEIKRWITQYKTEFCIDDEYKVEIFNNALRFLGNYKPRFIYKQMVKGRINADYFALNIIQNIAMTTVLDGDIREVIKQNGTTYSAIELYNEINQKKLELHYIDFSQFEQNENLIEKIQTQMMSKF